MDEGGGMGNEVLSSDMARELLISISYTLPEDINLSSVEISSQNLRTINRRNVIAAAASRRMENGYIGTEDITRSRLISLSSSSSPIQSQDHVITTNTIASHSNGHL